jgi:acylphosphatase
VAMSERVTLHLVIRGRVQGVGFRYALREEAVRLGLAGWVRNRRDGSVEAVVQGRAPEVEAMRRWAEHGPPSAQVDAVQATPAEGAFEGFETRPSA